MILEAFSETLHDAAAKGTAPETVLHHWLSDILDRPPQSKVETVIHTEISRLTIRGQRYFSGRSATGKTLLDSLYRYCHSYQNWQFTRWLHHVKASDFHSGTA